MAKDVAPPHTARSVKQCILLRENINEITTTGLFVSASSRTPMGDSSLVSILTYPGPGCSPSDPMALVLSFSGAVRVPFGVAPSEAVYVPCQEGRAPFNTQYCRAYEGLLEITD